MQGAARATLARLGRRVVRCQRSLEWCVFVLGLTFPLVMALVVTPVEKPVSAADASAPSAHVAAACRVRGTPEAHLHYSCRNREAAQGFGRDCDSVYWWAVTLPLQLEPPSPWHAPPGGGAAASGGAVEVSVRAGSFSEAERLLRRFTPPGAPLACLLDGSGGVRSVGGPNATAPVLPASPAPRRAPAPPASPGPLALVVLHAAWDSLLGRVGAAARPPPAWLTRLGWLPWARCCGPGVPLLVLSSLSAAARVLRRDAGRDAGALGALSAATMVAAAGEAAAALLAEARRSAAARVAAAASLLPVAATLVYVAAGTVLVAGCVAEPLQRELARLAAAVRDADAAPADHPLGEPLPRRAMTRSLSSALGARPAAGQQL